MNEAETPKKIQRIIEQETEKRTQNLMKLNDFFQSQNKKLEIMARTIEKTADTLVKLEKTLRKLLEIFDKPAKTSKNYVT